MASVKRKRNLKALEQGRRKGMRMHARGLPQAEFARALQVSRQTVSRWARASAEDAQAGRRKPPGGPGGLADAELAQSSKPLVDAALACGFPSQLWTLARVGGRVEVHFGRLYSATQVCRFLRSLGGSRQRAMGRAIQRDESAILQCKNKRLPALKLSAGPEAAISSSTTSRD